MEIKGAVYNLFTKGLRYVDCVKKGARPFRNKPCPCGSKLKYKKCCKEYEEYTPKAINKRDADYMRDFAEVLGG
jgi:uncharacterized protein YchJ